MRIANDRADSTVAEEAASDLISTSDAQRVGGIQLESTTITYQDLRTWVADARDGLTYIDKDAIKSVSTNLLCQYVIVFVTDPHAVRLSCLRRSRLGTT